MALGLWEIVHEGLWHRIRRGLRPARFHLDTVYDEFIQARRLSPIDSAN